VRCVCIRVYRIYRKKRSRPEKGMLTITLFARAAFSINAPIVFPPKQRITSHSKITLASLKSQFNVGILLRDVRANINYYKDLSLGI
jgi:hypothetical protein